MCGTEMVEDEVEDAHIEGLVEVETDDVIDVTVALQVVIEADDDEVGLQWVPLVVQLEEMVVNELLFSDILVLADITLLEVLKHLLLFDEFHTVYIHLLLTEL